MSNRPDYSGWRIGTYELVKRLGSGGFGDVYLAKPSHRSAQFAIKLLLGFSREEALDFINEARILTRLKHPNIVSLFDFGTGKLQGYSSKIEDNPYLVMEYASRGSLREFFPLGQPPSSSQIPLDRVVGYIGQVASALQCAHNNDLAIIHRDVKPANMLLADDGRILLSDFGISTPVSTSSSISPNIRGTSHYLAPEQWQGKAIKQSDQYSLAIVAYQWLAGRRPFEGTYAQLFWQHLNECPPSLIGQVPNLPRDVEQVIFKALEKDPLNRFASVQEFADALQRASNPNRLVLAPPVPPPTQTLPDVRRQQIKRVPEPNIDQNQSHTPPLPPVPEKPTRRLLITRIGSIGFILVGGGLAYLVGKQLWAGATPSSPMLGSTQAIPTPSPKATPYVLGKTLYIYTGYIGHKDLVNTVAWSHGDTRIASGGDDAAVRIWDAANGGHALNCTGHTDVVNSLAWSPDGQRIASGSADSTVQIWDAITGHPAHTCTSNHAVNAVVWSLDSRRIASGSAQYVQIWNTVNGQLMLTCQGHTGPVYGLSWSPDNQHIASGSYDATVKIWDTFTGNSVFTYKGHESHVNTVAWSPDGKYIASGGGDGTVHIWNAANGDPVFTYRGHTPGFGGNKTVNVVVWSPDNQRIASGGVDGTVQVWDVVDGQHAYIYREHTDEVRAVAWSSDGRRIASGSADSTVHIWGAG